MTTTLPTLPPRLEPALNVAADALAELTADQWEELCREEAAELIAMHQYFDAVGFSDSFPPERLLGARIIAFGLRPRQGRYAPRPKAMPCPGRSKAMAASRWQPASAVRRSCAPPDAAPRERHRAFRPPGRQ